MDKSEYAEHKEEAEQRTRKNKTMKFVPCCNFVVVAAAASSSSAGCVFRVGPSFPFIYAFCALRFALTFALLGVSHGGRARVVFVVVVVAQGH